MHMIVTAIEIVPNGKRKIFLDEEFAFVLYKGELSRYHIKEGEELLEEFYQTITTEVLVKRARLRSMNILKSFDKTEEELRRKLQQGMYPKDIIDNAIEYVKSYGYIDDSRYVQNYITYKGRRKSKRMIEMELMGKGIDKDIITSIYEEVEENMDLKLIRKLVEKKRIDFATIDRMEYQKLYQFLMRKGFKSEDIRQVLEENSHEM